MAYSDKNILVIPAVGDSDNDPRIIFSAAGASTGPFDISLFVNVDSGGTLSFEGSAGQLFSITNSFSGTFYSVNDGSGVPSLEVVDDGTVKIARFSGNVLFGTNTNNGTDKLQVNGSIIGTVLKSSVAQGTAPLTVTSTTVVTNLNSDLLDGQEGSYYRDAGNLNAGTVPTARLGSGTANNTTYLRGDSTWATIPASTAISDITTNGTYYPLFAASTSGTLSSAYVSSTKITINPSTGTITISHNSDTSTIAAAGFSGVGTSLTALNASNLSSGTVPTAQLGSGTANSGTYLRGDSTWASVPPSTTITNDESTNSSFYPLVASSNTGTLSTAYTSSSKLTFNPSTGLLTSTGFSGSGASLSSLNASNLSSGTVSIDRLGSSGTKNSTTYLAGDNTWKSFSSVSEISGGTSYYVAMLNATTGVLGTVYVKSGTLLFDQATGVLSATGFSGSGANLSSIPETAISDGSLLARVGSTETITQIWTFNAIPAFNGGTSGASAPFTVDSTYLVTNLNADKLDGNDGSYYTNATNLSSGTVDSARLGSSGTRDSTTFLRGDNTWQAITSIGGGGTLSDDTTTNGTYYLTLSTATTGTLTTVYTSSTKLQFNPSSGTLFATQFQSLSDERIKINVRGNPGLPLIEAMNPVKFEWKAMPDKTSYGLIAQELEKILPELVTELNTGFKAVSYIPIISILVAAVQQLSGKTTALQAKVQELESLMGG